jgi:Flp pilus assembly protein TadG
MRLIEPLWPRPAARRRLRGAATGENGTAMVEFGFLAPVFIAILCAIMEFSGIMFVQAMLEGSAREASRYGLTGFTSGGVSRADQILAIVEDHTYGIVDMDEQQMRPGSTRTSATSASLSRSRTRTATRYGTTTSRSTTSTATVPGTPTWAPPAWADRATWSSIA